MDYLILPTTEDPWQVFCLPASPDGHAFQAKVELRYLPAPDRWIFSISDAVTGHVYVPNVPLVCSYGEINDLLRPFRFLFQGNGIGSLFCLKAVDRPSAPDPAKGNLNQFRILWGDEWAAAGGG